MYESWKLAPDSVHVSWRAYFNLMQDKSKSPDEAAQFPPGYLSSRDPVLTSSLSSETYANHRHRVAKLVSAYQTHGHYVAATDPLGLRKNARGDAHRPEELNPEHHGFTPADMNTPFLLGDDVLPFFAAAGHTSMTLGEIIFVCESIYCGALAVEYTHIPSAAKRTWLQQRLEIPSRVSFSVAEKRRILGSLLWAATFERFLATKFPSQKRFGLDGAEALAPGVATVIDRSADKHGVDDVVVGSCHRGKMTMLGAVYGKPREDILAEFAGRMKTNGLGMTGDVKYHLGHDGTRVTPRGREVGVCLLANPSHLEAVDPVATGATYATQQRKNDTNRSRTLCLALHGDAAFAGQGVVYETLGLSRLESYHVGGTVRIIVNNQIGFTTDVSSSRSTPHASDLARCVDAPMLHVNADDVEAVAFACGVAADWRAEFGEDVVVDLMCYRRFGHNEFDQPGFTQPVMYQQVARQTPVLDKYVARLVAEGSFTAAEIEEQRAWVWEQLKEDFDRSKTRVSQRTSFPPAWDALPSPAVLAKETLPDVSTAIPYSALRGLAEELAAVPPDFSLHPNLSRILTTRATSFQAGTIDWPTAESLAFASLVTQGTPVRLAGQDVQRGTFSQRHLVLHDQATGSTYTPLNHLSPTQAPFHAANSPLSEFAAMGFEYGVTLADPRPLVLWEAQFGDFANGAQVIVDNFLVSGEAKWLDRSGLVVLLPHGMDGQGAEHSSARLERFLMLGGEEGREWPSEERLSRGHQECNFGVVNLTDPANYFHVLRRQVMRGFRKREFDEHSPELENKN